MDIQTSPEMANSTLSNHDRFIVSQILMRLPLTIILLLVGVAVMFGPKWNNNLIHISVVSGHGLTTQDAVAMLPISLGIAWFIGGLWKHRSFLRQKIRNSPEKAFLLALGIGLLIGLFMGLALGAVFESVIVSLYRVVVQPLKWIKF